MEGRAAGGLIWFLGQMFFIPLQTLAFGMERTVDILRGIQGTSERGMAEILAKPDPGQPAIPAPASPDAQSPVFSQAAVGGDSQPVASRSDGILPKEMKRMDKELNDDMLKLVRYKILFVKRDYEHAFGEREELVSDNMDGAAFTAWKIAEFIQRLQKKHEDVPFKFSDYGGAEYISGNEANGYQLKDIKHDDKKFLRVYYEVLERYNREKLLYEESQLTELRKLSKYVEKIANK